MSRKALIVVIGLVLIAALAVFLYSTFSAEPWDYITQTEADALCRVRHTVNGQFDNAAYLACMEDLGY